MVCYVYYKLVDVMVSNTSGYQEPFSQLTRDILSWCMMDFFSCLQLFKHTQHGVYRPSALVL